MKNPEGHRFFSQPTSYHPSTVREGRMSQMSTPPNEGFGPQGSIVAAQRSARPIDPGVTIGHVHLDVLGFDVTAEARDVPGWGTTGDILFVSAGGYHHHLGFNTWKSAG